MKIEYQRNQDNIIADVFSRLSFAENVEKPTALDDAPRSAKPLESKAPSPNFLEKPFTTLFILDSTVNFLQSDEDLSDSDHSDSDCDLELSDGETDSNSNYLDEVPEDLPPRSSQCETLPPRLFNPIDVAAPIIDLPISRAKIQVNNFQTPTSEEIATAQSADPELM